MGVFSWGCPGLFREQLEEEQDRQQDGRDAVRKEGSAEESRVVGKVAAYTFYPCSIVTGALWV